MECGWPEGGQLCGSRGKEIRKQRVMVLQYFSLNSYDVLGNIDILMYWVLD